MKYVFSFIVRILLSYSKRILECRITRVLEINFIRASAVILGTNLCICL